MNINMSELSIPASWKRNSESRVCNQGFIVPKFVFT